MFQDIKRILQKNINAENRKRLTNQSPTLICSNCTGGFLYHWLGLEFRSPFINLFLTPNDFVTMLEDFDAFINTDLSELDNSGHDYPVGKGLHGELIHFMHYKTFEEAIEIWNRRKERINKNNMGVMLTNLSPNVFFDTGGCELIERFEHLPFEHKVCFVSKPLPQFKSTFYIKGYDTIGNKNLYATQSITGKRYIDQFDYVKFINRLKKDNE